MACFVVTTVAAIGVGAARHIVKHNEKKNNVDKVDLEDKFFSSKKLGYLELTLWGGSFLLAGEHAFHGEITYRFPFFPRCLLQDPLSLHIADAPGSGKGGGKR